MESFDFFMGFFGLLLGLTLAEMLSRLGDLIADRERVHIG